MPTSRMDAHANIFSRAMLWKEAERLPAVWTLPDVAFRWGPDAPYEPAPNHKAVVDESGAFHAIVSHAWGPFPFSQSIRAVAEALAEINVDPWGRLDLFPSQVTGAPRGKMQLVLFWGDDDPQLEAHIAGERHQFHAGLLLTDAYDGSQAWRIEAFYRDAGSQLVLLHGGTPLSLRVTHDKSSETWRKKLAPALLALQVGRRAMVHQIERAASRKVGRERIIEELASCGLPPDQWRHVVPDAAATAWDCARALARAAHPGTRLGPGKGQPISHAVRSELLTRASKWVALPRRRS